MAAGIRGGMGVGSLILIAASIMFMFFVVLSGVTNSVPLSNTWFLQADTSTIPGAHRSTSQWTFWFVCGANNRDCGAPVPALPIGYAWVDGSAGAPEALVGGHAKHTTSYHYYYTWRFGWVFYLMAFVLDVFGLFTALLAPCSRLASGLSGLIIGSALFFMTMAASMMTAIFVEARNRFHDAGLSASIGSAAFGFTWAAWACMVLATIMLFLGCGLGGRSSGASSRASRIDRSTPTQTTRSPPRGIRTTTAGSSLGFWRRQRRRTGPSAFPDTESQHRVKDEYA